MKTLYLILSNLASLVFGYLFISNLKYSIDLSYILLMSMLLVLFFIFLVISIMNFPKRTKSRTLFYNSYSDRRTKNVEFDKFYSFMNE
ncbi:hypothetical protein [Flavobacterium sp.]